MLKHRARVPVGSGPNGGRESFHDLSAAGSDQNSLNTHLEWLLAEKVYHPQGGRTTLGGRYSMSHGQLCCVMSWTSEENLFAESTAWGRVFAQQCWKCAPTTNHVRAFFFGRCLQAEHVVNTEAPKGPALANVRGAPDHRPEPTPQPKKRIKPQAKKFAANNTAKHERQQTAGNQKPRTNTRA